MVIAHPPARESSVGGLRGGTATGGLEHRCAIFISVRRKTRRLIGLRWYHGRTHCSASVLAGVLCDSSYGFCKHKQSSNGWAALRMAAAAPRAVVRALQRQLRLLFPVRDLLRDGCAHPRTTTVPGAWGGPQVRDGISWRRTVD